jgi:energy-coupling factor transporter transmembrane protein EcfT
MIRKPSYSEDTVSNPYHAVIALITFITMLFLIKKLGWKPLIYAVCAISGFIIYSGLYKWHLFNVRYHLSFFILFAPVFGLTLGQFEKVRWGAMLAAILWVTSIPYLVSLETRPLIPITGISSQPSILSQSREELRFANCQGCYPIFKSLVEQIEARSCSEVGIMLNGDAGEYLFWHLFDLPQDELRIEWIVAGTPSERYKPLDFQPCAIICEGCDQQSVRDLGLFSLENGYALYQNAEGE